MLNNKYLLRKNQKIKLMNMINSESEKLYSSLDYINEINDKFLYISIISSISLNIYDFYIDINRRNNIFYSNVKYINTKLLKTIYKLISSYIIIKFIETNKIDENCDIIIENTLKIFSYNHKEKKLFYKLKNYYNNDEIDFDLKFNFLFAKKIFSSKKNNAMEFAYINYFMENLYIDFYSSYEENMDKSIMIS